MIFVKWLCDSGFLFYQTRRWRALKPPIYKQQRLPILVSSIFAYLYHPNFAYLLLKNCCCLRYDPVLPSLSVPGWYVLSAAQIAVRLRYHTRCPCLCQARTYLRPRSRPYRAPSGSCAPRWSPTSWRWWTPSLRTTSSSGPASDTRTDRWGHVGGLDVRTRPPVLPPALGRTGEDTSGDWTWGLVLRSCLGHSDGQVRARRGIGREDSSSDPDSDTRMDTQQPEMWSVFFQFLHYRPDPIMTCLLSMEFVWAHLIPCSLVATLHGGSRYRRGISDPRRF